MFEMVLKVTCKYMYTRVIKYVKYLNDSDIIKVQICLLLLALPLKQADILNMIITKRLKQVLVLWKLILLYTTGHRIQTKWLAVFCKFVIPDLVGGFQYRP